MRIMSVVCQKSYAEFVANQKKCVPLHPLMVLKARQSKISLTHYSTMYLDSEKKKEIFGQYGASNTDTGSPEAQVALFSYRISHLTEHMKANRKDHSTERALTRLVGKRRALLKYLKARDIERYRAIVKKLGLRK